jgi:uncharacterized protein YbjT (DUF2867 family)
MTDGAHAPKPKQSLVAAVVGATGVVGRELVQALCADEQFSTVHVLSRRPMAGHHPEKLRQHTFNFADLSEVNWPRADVLFCCLGTTIKLAGSEAGFRQVDFDYVVQTAQCALAAHTPALMVVSGLGAHSDSKIFYNRVKGEMEQAVASLGFARVGIFRPSLLRANRSESRPSERLALHLMKLGDYFLPKKYRSVPARSVALAMLHLAKEKRAGVQIIESDRIQDFTAQT